MFAYECLVVFVIVAGMMVIMMTTTSSGILRISGVLELAFVTVFVGDAFAAGVVPVVEGLVFEVGPFFFEGVF